MHANLRAYVPANCRADNTGAEVIVACVRVAEHDGKVFGDVFEEDKEGMLCCDVLRCAENVVGEGLLVGSQVKVLRIARTEELKDHLHQLFAGQFGAGEPLKDGLAVLGIEASALLDTAPIGGFEF